MKSSELKAIIEKHNRLAGDAMNIEYDTGNMPLKKYKNFIDTNEVIKEILADVVIASKTAPELFVSTVRGIYTNESENETEDLAIQYKEITTLVNNDENIRDYASRYFSLKYKKFNDMINELLSICLKPLVKYIQEALKTKLYEIEEVEKVQMVVHGDYVNGVQQKNNKKAVNKQKVKFEFNKENFFLGIISAVVVEVVAWGIIELVKLLIQ